MDRTEAFEAERPRLVTIAERVLGDHAEAEDVVQQAWLRLHRTESGIDNLPGSVPLETLRLPRQVCLLFGQEGPGLSPEARAVCDATFSIAQFGSTRSINASAAAAVAMHTWVVQHADLSGGEGPDARAPWRG